MFGIGPTELIFFLVILLLAVGPEKLPTFMRTVGKGLRQLRSASREFKDAIGLDELMREGDPFRAPPVRPPRARPVPVQTKEAEPQEQPQAQPTTPPPVPPTSDAAQALQKPATSEPATDVDAPPDPDASAGANHP
ncbi:MAG: twin-arginine translocase TatA/TatE family subunit [Myxococcales bacterium]|nr:twin-arginine translocase TatA/TatE family subunit [Myxococcales bacterium]MDH3485114.1 twin-arginine translocase TatA/TatE family subunit [Myxococcales bacterium]